MRRPLNVSIVGCGAVAIDRHISAFKKIREVNIVTLVDHDLARVKKVASFSSVSRVYHSLSEMLQEEKLDLVDICTPPQTHAQLIMQAMDKGCHVLVEKPMAMTTKECKEILHSQKGSGVKLGVIHNWLFQPPLLKVRSIVDKGSLGDIIGARIEVLSPPWDIMAANEKHWVHKLPGGRFGEMLIHPIYLLQHFLGGALKVENVSTCKLGNYNWMPYDELHVTLRSVKGLGSIYASFNSPRENVTMSIYGRETVLRVELITGTILVLGRSHYGFPNYDKSAIGIDVLRQASHLLTSATKNASKAIFGKYPTGHETYIRLFVNSLINEKEPPVTTQDAYEAVRVLEEVCTLTS